MRLCKGRRVSVPQVSNGNLFLFKFQYMCIRAPSCCPTCFRPTFFNNPIGLG